MSLALLHQAGCLHWRDPFHFQISHRPRTLEPDLPPALKQTMRDPIDLMDALIGSRRCRWQTLLTAFGYTQTSPCGTCDRCHPAPKTR
ncbi:MAG: hypothetical protein OHK0012_25410 [Synechococcales cyanobacterium]